MFAATRRARLARGVHGIHLDVALSRKAQRHSAAMARANRLYHSPNVPAYLRGDHWHTWGENIGYAPGGVRSLQRMFMHSPEHRANILKRSFKRVGVGAVVARGMTWVTLVFYG